MASSRGIFTKLDDSANMPIQRVFSICLVKAVKTIRSGGDEPERAELPQLVLNGMKGEATFQR
jgi:hypothetical protein